MNRRPRGPLLPTDLQPFDPDLLPGGAEGVLVEGGDLTGVQSLGADLEHVVLRGCRLTGACWAAGTWTDVLVEDCRADDFALRHVTLERVRFAGCSLQGLDLLESRLHDVLFERCDLRRADFQGARATRTGLKGCQVEGLQGWEDGLQGLQITVDELLELAPVLAARAGLVLLGPDED